MARTIERRDTGGVVVAEPPVILEPHETPITTPIPRRTSRRSLLKGITLVAGGLGAGAVLYQTGIIQTGLNWADKFFKERDENILRREALAIRSLGPQAGEQTSWWMELPEARIRQLAQLPEIHQIGERYVSTVSPALQEKAQQAGYKLIYQGDPEDTVGRTVVTKGRQIDEYWASEDLGFGGGGTNIRGIFKAWVPDIQDPNQKEKVYALLHNPATKQEYIVAVQLFPYDPNNFGIRPTWFVVGNLNYGPEYVREKSALTGRFLTNKKTGEQRPFTINPDLVPDPEDPPSVQSKKLTNFPTFNDLVREKGLELTDLIKPGDYVIAGLQVVGVDEEAGKQRFKLDEHGVPRTIDLVVRRFGGLNQWQAEVQR